MKNNNLFFFAFILCLTNLPLFSSYGKVPQKDIYLNPNLSFEKRVDDLVSRMTLEEKAGQLLYTAPAIERLHIPAHNWWNECLHGVARSGIATVFPQAIGMAAMWDDKEMFAIANAISDEARAKHHEYASRGKRGIYQGLSYWTPNINIFRDPRWGRGMETYGEDPYLSGELAVDFIKGLQGNDPKYLKLIATVKHFAVHSGPESTRHSFDVNPSEYDFAETYTPHFKKTVQEAKVYSVMCAYQRFRGAPCCGSQFLDNLLRNKWGFQGYIVSDCGAISDFYKKQYHHVVNTVEEASAMAIKAGTDLNCGDSYKSLIRAVQQGLLIEADLDVCVKRVMMARMKLGQFDSSEKVKYAQIPYSVVDSKEHRQLALEAARKSIVLLKNENRLLPIRKQVKKVAVIGPNADDLEVLLANYNGFPSKPITPLQGIREKLPQADVRFAQGCALAQGLPYLQAIPVGALFTDESKQIKGLKGEYFANSNLEGTPLHTRIDPTVDFVWWTKAPFEDMKYEHYSVRWSGVIVPPVSGEYAIGAEALYGFKLYLDDKLISQWKNRDMTHKEYELLKLEAGKSYKLRFEYQQDETEYATARLLWEMPNPNLMQEAIDLAKSSDLIVLFMGLSPLLEGEEMKVKVEGFSHGDRLDVNLPAIQTTLIKKIHALGKPTVLVMLNGSALAFNWEADAMPAIIEAWYPGQAAGSAIADVIFGDYNPAGRLPITFYKSIDQIPAFDEYDMQGKTYRYFQGEPLYEFGYGLSYTTFEYQWGKIPAEIKTGQDIELSVSVKNTGKYDGDEVVQLYVSLPDSKFKTAIRSLQGFQRIHLKSGESKLLRFLLKPRQFAALDANNQPCIAQGSVLVSVGGKQPDKKSIESKAVIQKQIKAVGAKVLVME